MQLKPYSAKCRLKFILRLYFFIAAQIAQLICIKWVEHLGNLSSNEETQPEQ